MLRSETTAAPIAAPAEGDARGDDRRASGPSLAARLRWHWRRLERITDRLLPFTEPYRERSRLVSAFAAAHGRPPRLDPPVTFNEKIVAASLSDHHPLLTLCSDKIAVLDYVAARIGTGHLLPLLGVWSDPAEIDWNRLPSAFVLKPSHASGLILKVEDRARLDRAASVATMRRWLAIDYYRDGFREWRYRNVPRRILAQPLLPSPPEGGSPHDHSVFVFAGEPRVLKICAGLHRADGIPQRVGWYDLATRQRLPFRHNRREPLLDALPADLDCDALAGLASSLGADFDAVRVDFLWSGGRHWFGELTFTDNAGQGLFDPPEWDERIGAAWPLRSGKARFVRPGVAAPAPAGAGPDRVARLN